MAPRASASGNDPRHGDAAFWNLRLRSIRRVLPDRQVADVLGVASADVRGWRIGEGEPGPAVADRLVGLDLVVGLLDGYLDPGSIPKWLTGSNAHLANRRPADVLRQGSLSEVVAAVEALKSASYA